jgi:hypothetical protein
MKHKHILHLLLAMAIIFSSCGQKSNSSGSSSSSESSSSSSSSNNSEETEKQTEKTSEEKTTDAESEKEKSSKGPAWNYSGYLGKYKIKAMINYEEATHSEGTGAIQIPISGYYFYESVKVKIPIKGSCNGTGSIWLTAYTEGGEESFDGNFTNEQLGDFSGTWSKDSRSMQFSLKSK